MGTPHYPKTIVDTVKDLRRAAAAAYTSSNVRPALTKIKAQALELLGQLTVDGGTFTVKDTDGNTLAKIGHLEMQDGEVFRGIEINRAGGKLTFLSYGKDADPDHAGYWALYDLAGNIVFSDDVVSGEGIGRPWLPINFGPSDYRVWPGTDQAAFTSLWETAVLQQQPKVVVTVMATTDVSGTTGEVRLTCNGTQLGSTVSVGFAQTYYDFGPVALPAGNYAYEIALKVEARRTAGTGLVRASVTKAYTRQS